MIISMVYKNMFIKHFYLKILENDSNQIEMRPIRYCSNVSNFYLISDYRTTTPPFSQKMVFLTNNVKRFSQKYFLTLVVWFASSRNQQLALEKVRVAGSGSHLLYHATRGFNNYVLVFIIIKKSVFTNELFSI